jgi:hypothetical protein
VRAMYEIIVTKAMGTIMAWGGAESAWTLRAINNN